MSTNSENQGCLVPPPKTESEVTGASAWVATPNGTIHQGVRLTSGDVHVPATGKVYRR